jgi:glutamate-5-semialdehyde dehydrogenase
MNCIPVFKRVVNASKELSGISIDVINKILCDVAGETLKNSDYIISENKKDLAKMDVSDPRYDRLELTTDRIKGIVADIVKVSELQSPVGKILSETTRPNGLKISRISVPFGVIGIIYEARPNVTFDVFALCFKSGNACILKGGSDAINSNVAITKIIRSVLEKNGINPDTLALLPAVRNKTAQLLTADKYVDMIVPRGSRGLIDFVRANATIPVIETGAGICHTYFDESGDKELGRKIINNAKTRRVSVCNALDCVIIHENRLNDLDYLVGLCADKNVIIYADAKAYKSLKGKYPAELLMKADKNSFGVEFLSYKMTVKTVSSAVEAIEHINTYGSKHSEAIISESDENIELFKLQVDASSIYTNTSTAFTDGGEFGLGAEIGISTQKLHARGPMALEALTTYKWIIDGNGQIR